MDLSMFTYISIEPLTAKKNMFVMWAVIKNNLVFCIEGIILPSYIEIYNKPTLGFHHH